MSYINLVSRQYLVATFALTLMLIFGVTSEVKAQPQPNAPAKPLSWETFDFTEAEFIQRFNKLSKGFKAKPIAKTNTSTNAVATTSVFSGLDRSQRIVVSTPIGHKNAKAIRIYREIDRSFDVSARFILSMLLSITATNPEMSSSERESVLRDIGVVRTKDEAHLPANTGSATRGKIEYYFVAMEDTMQFTISVNGEK